MSLLISTIFCMSNLTLPLVRQLLLLLNAPQSIRASEQRTGLSHIMPLSSGKGFQRNSVSRSFTLHTLISLTLPQLFLLYPNLRSTPSSKLTFSANYFLLSLFHTCADGSSGLLTWLLYFSSHSHFHCITHIHFVLTALQPIIGLQYLGISLHQVTLLVGFL